MSEYTLQGKTYEELNDIEKCFYYIIDRLAAKKEKPGNICMIEKNSKNPHKEQSTGITRIIKSVVKSVNQKSYDEYKTFLATNQNNDFYNVDNVMKEMLDEMFDKNITIFGKAITYGQNKIVCKDDFIHFFENSQDILQFISYCICLVEHYQNDPDQRKQMIIYNAYSYIIYKAKYVIDLNNQAQHKKAVIISIISILKQWMGDICMIETKLLEQQLLEQQLLEQQLLEQKSLEPKSPEQQSQEQQLLKEKLRKKKLLLEEQLFTKDDLNSIITTVFKGTPVKGTPVKGLEVETNTKTVDTLNIDEIPIINTKIENFVTEFSNEKNPIVFADNFGKIYITSDIHADLRKFVQTLINNKIITIEDIDPYTDDIYSPELITNITWIKTNTLLIIVGDLIDGARNKENNGELHTKIEVDDPQGSFELRLHLFIFNMRIKAMQMNSEVRFTMGNHDHSLFCNNEPFYMSYIHSSSMRFFNRSKLIDDIKEIRNLYNKKNIKITIPYNLTDDTVYTGYSVSNRLITNKDLITVFDYNIGLTLATRKTVLKPFYRCSPYYYTAVKFKNSPRYEVFCIHAGVRKENINILYELQHNFDTQHQVDLNECTVGVYNNSKYNNIEHPLFERNYATLEESCNEIPFHIKKLVIGHCITENSKSSTAPKIKDTTMYTYMDNLYKKKNINKQCKNKGCILSGCDNKVIFVDTGMAQQNNDYARNGNENHSREIELLLLEKKTISTDLDTGFSQQNFEMNSILNGKATYISGGNHTHVGGLSLFIAKQKKNHRKTRRRKKHKRAVTNRKKNSDLRP